MDTMDIYRQLTPVFQEIFEDDTLELNAALTADAVPGWDSLTHLRMMLSVQRAFKVKFTAGEIGKLKNVGELVNLIQAKAT